MDDYFLVVSLPVTLIILAASILYSWNNISRLWKAGDPHQHQTANEESDHEIDDVIVKPAEMTNEEFMSYGGSGDAGSGLLETDADPYEYCGHIQSEVKKARQRVATREIRQNLSEDDLEAEREAQRNQLEDIFKLMAQQNDRFGMENMDEVKDQMRLYC